MKIVYFEVGGNQLKVKFEFIGLIAASYAFTLWEANSNQRVMYEKGNNQNSEDDSYLLPHPPPEQNHERLIQLRTEFIGLDPAANKDYTIVASVYQGGKFLDDDKDTGEITGKAQKSLIFIPLKKKES